METTEEPTRSRVRHGLGMLAVGALGAIGWVIALALKGDDGGSQSVELFGLIAVLTTVIGIIGGLCYIAVGLLRD